MHRSKQSMLRTNARLTSMEMLLLEALEEPGFKELDQDSSSPASRCAHKITVSSRGEDAPAVGDPQAIQEPAFQPNHDATPLTELVVCAGC